MSCQEITFESGTCQIEIADRTEYRDMPLYAVRMWLVDDAGSRHPLVAADGSSIELHESTEMLALESALTYLSSQFGAMREYPRPCAGEVHEPDAGVPLVVEGQAGGRPGAALR